MASELTLVPDDLEFDATIRGLDADQKIFGRYTLRRVLGRGGMGIVWLGYDERLEREVALKFLPDVVNCDPAALDELKRETRRCLDLTHPNILRIYDFVEDRRAAAISMEYVDGKTLAALRIEKAQRVFEVDEIKNWIGKVCDALHYAHEEAGVVHRDLKPANLMLTSRGQIKVADFGIAQSMCDSISRVTMRRGSSGTLAYMSPQQMGGDMSRVTDDVYALGATIYEFLTSKPPFYTGDVPFQVRLSVPRTLSERRNEFGITGRPIPHEWEETIAACLAKVPEERPASMLELAERLGLGSSPMRASAASAASAVSPVMTRSSVPKIKPPPLPRQQFSTQSALRIGGIALAVGLIIWPLWSFLLWPLVAAPGEIRLNSNPNGATIHISGQPDRVTPAALPHLRIGQYHLMLSAPGYDPAEQTVTVTAGAVVNLGTVELKRALGQLNLTTQPPHVHYVLAGGQDTGFTQKEGTSPALLSELPSGRYQLALDETGFPSATETIEIPAHGTVAEQADLIKMAVAAGASPQATKAFLEGMPAAQLDEKTKNEMVTLLDRAFERYLSYGLVAAAADQLASLKNLGQNTDAAETQLNAKRSLIEGEVTAQISGLIKAKKFATAAERLKILENAVEKESQDRLNALFQMPLAQYEQQVDAALQANQNQPPALALAQLKPVSQQYPDDLRLQLAMARAQTHLAPDHDGLTRQLKAFHQYIAQNKDFANEPALLGLQDVFTNELKQLDTLTAALAGAKEGPSGARSQLARLKAQKRVLEDRRVGKPQTNPFAQAFNFFGKAMVGHSVVNTPAFFSSQREKEEAIEEVQEKINNAEAILALPQDALTDAQKRYDDFMAQVPWGPQ